MPLTVPESLAQLDSPIEDLEPLLIALVSAVKGRKTHQTETESGDRRTVRAELGRGDSGLRGGHVCVYEYVSSYMDGWLSRMDDMCLNRCSNKVQRVAVVIYESMFSRHVTETHRPRWRSEMSFAGIIFTATNRAMIEQQPRSFRRPASSFVRLRGYFISRCLCFVTKRPVWSVVVTNSLPHMMRPPPREWRDGVRGYGDLSCIGFDLMTDWNMKRFTNHTLSESFRC